MDFCDKVVPFGEPQQIMVDYKTMSIQLSEQVAVLKIELKGCERLLSAVLDEECYGVNQVAYRTIQKLREENSRLLLVAAKLSRLVSKEAATAAGFYE